MCLLNQEYVKDNKQNVKSYTEEVSKKLNMYNCLETIDDAMEEVVAKQKELVR